MKKLFAVLAVFGLLFNLSGCDTGENVENIDKKGTIYVYAGTASSLEIAHNSKGFTFPDTYIDESAEATIVIKNTGKGNIKLTGSPYVNLDGATAVFSISSAVETSTINPGSSASFKIKFSPINAVESYVYVSIPNNSENIPDFSFTVYGTGLRPKPTASIFYGDNEIPQNGTINAGEVRITQSKIIPVIIKNTGREVLTIDTANITISGADAAAFTQTTDPGGSVSVGSQTFFNIEYKPARQGENNAILVIPTNDTSRNPVIVYLRATAGAAPKPTASVFYGDNEIPQNGTINAGIVVITLSKNIAVVIKNTGEETLTLDTANITITGTDAEAFTKITNPAGSISVGEQTSFIISCEPVKQGENDATLIIPTNDHSRNPVVVYLRMTAEKGAAVLQLSQGTTVIANNSLTPFDFGRVALGSNKPLVFTIKNIGNIDLELTGNPAVVSSNAVFTIPAQPANNTIYPNTEVSFLLQYNPTVEAEENAVITIYNNSDNMVFTFNVKGTGYIKKPQMVVKHDNSAVSQYGEYNFGSVVLGESKDVTFDIENIGEANLNIISVNGSRINFNDNENGLFSVIQQPLSAVAPGNSTNFVVRFSPTTEENNFTATVHIKTDSQDNDDFYFLVKGIGYIKRPQITVISGTAAISPNVTYSFGDSIFYTETKSLTFRIQNSGEAILAFTTVNGNCINLENNTAGHFSVSQPSVMTLHPGNSTNFTVLFNPSTWGSFTVIVRIVTDSQYDDDFSFRLTGNSRNYYVIGDTGPAGGIIFYDAGSTINGWRYLEASLTDFNAQWGAYGYTVGGTGLSIGDGKQNTQRIVARLNQLGQTGCAAQVCTNLNINGFTDWFLPSRDELNLMYQRRTTIGGFSNPTVSNSYYWSSSELSSSSAAYRQSFYSGSQSTYEKGSTFKVRAIRAFSL